MTPWSAARACHRLGMLFLAAFANRPAILLHRHFGSPDCTRVGDFAHLDQSLYLHLQPAFGLHTRYVCGGASNKIDIRHVILELDTNDDTRGKWYNIVSVFDICIHTNAQVNIIISLPITSTRSCRVRETTKTLWLAKACTHCRR